MLRELFQAIIILEVAVVSIYLQVLMCAFEPNKLDNVFLQVLNKAKEVFDTLKGQFTISWDDRGNIGKRYLSQDEIGTPYCITVDFQTLEDNTVTVRDRNTTEQERISVEKLEDFLKEKLK